jgi:hypothetical protein
MTTTTMTTTTPPVVVSTAAKGPPPPAFTATPPQGNTSCGEGYYRNADGNCVHRPEQAPAPPAGATARCVDGTYSFSQHRQGTCSHHGGVAQWL